MFIIILLLLLFIFLWIVFNSNSLLKEQNSYSRYLNDQKNLQMILDSSRLKIQDSFLKNNAIKWMNISDLDTDKIKKAIHINYALSHLYMSESMGEEVDNELYSLIYRKNEEAYNNIKNERYFPFLMVLDQV